MNSNHHNPNLSELDEAQLTAYALGQLGQQERAAVEAKLARSDRARQFIEETRALAGHLAEAVRRPLPVQPSATLREAVEQHFSQLEDAAVSSKDGPPSPNKPTWGRPAWKILAVAACLLVAAIPLYLATLGTEQAGPRKVVLEQSAQTPANENSSRQGQSYSGQSQVAKEHMRTQLHRARATAEQVPARSEVRLNYQPLFVGDERLPDGHSKEERGGVILSSDSPTHMETQRLAEGNGPVTLLKTSENRSVVVGKGGVPVGRQPPGVFLGDLDVALKQYSLRRAVSVSGGHHQPTAPYGATKYLYRDGPALRENRQLDRHGRDSRDLPARLSYEHYGAMKIGDTGTAVRPLSETTPEAPGTEQYDPIVENEFLLAAEHPLSTFAVDVDTASYANVRRFLNDGRLPPPSAVRIEEMVNYFKYDYPLPEGDVPFSVNLEVAECPWNGDHRLVRVGLRGQQIDRDERGPCNLVFLLDVSGSMRDHNKLPLVRQAMTLLVDQLTEDDRVAIVTYANDAQVKLESTSGDQRQKILATIDGLTAGGSTHGSAGIQLAYDRAMSHFLQEGTNRVILATDGDLNVGTTEDDELVQLIRQKAQSGVFLTVLGFGTGNLKDSKLEKLADRGNGTYAYIDSLREARRVLFEQIAGSLVTIAKDVKIQIELNPAEVESYRLIGYENRLLAARDFHDDRKDAGEIGAGHTVTALYEIVPGEGRPADGSNDRGLKYQRRPELSFSEEADSGELLTLKLRYKRPEEDKSQLLEFTLKDQDKRFGEASADFRFASAVASFGMVLRGSKHRGDATLAAIEEFAAGAIGDDPGGYRAEFVDLIRHAGQLRPR